MSGQLKLLGANNFASALARLPFTTRILFSGNPLSPEAERRLEKAAVARNTCLEAQWYGLTYSECNKQTPQTKEHLRGEVVDAEYVGRNHGAARILGIWPNKKTIKKLRWQRWRRYLRR